MNIRLGFVILFGIGGASIAQAQSTSQPEPPLGASPQPSEAVPEIPAGEQGLDASPSTPVPGQTPPVQEELIPSERGAEVTSSTQEDILDPSADNQPGFQEDVVPKTTEQERAAEGDAIQPDMVPDRRFETFDNDTNGTPEMQPMSEEDDTHGGTDGLPPGGYGIGGPGR